MARPRHRPGAVDGRSARRWSAAVFGAVLGPVIGAIASVVGVTASFAAIAGLEALLVVVALGIEAPAPEREPVSMVFSALRDRTFLLGLWLMTIPALLFGALNVLTPLALDERGFGAVAIGVLWLTAAALETVINPWLGRVSDRIGPARPARIALMGGTVVSIGLALTEWPPLLVPLVLAGAVTFGALYSPALTMLSPLQNGSGSRGDPASA